MTEEVDLGDAGLAFIADRLEGGLSFSAALLESLDLHSGSVFTWIVGAESADVRDFSRSDVLGDVDGTAAAVRFVRSIFAGEPAASLWVEDPIRRRSDSLWGDPKYKSRTEGSRFLGDEVYSLALPDDDDARVVVALCTGWNWAGWGGVSFVSKCPAAARYRDDREIDRPDVVRLTSETCFIICGAYDGAGYLVWRPQVGSDV